ncbi:MAG TPA: glycosyltransferase, partial [Puia sp.]|nr:glycosyltransferase [Puia sp.]
RGMLRRSAVQFKSFKKKIYLQLFRQFGFQKKIFFQAADDTEQKDVLRYFGSKAKVKLVPNFPAKSSENLLPLQKNPGDLFVLYVGRIHPIKNLDYLLQILRKSASKIRLTIVGSVEDPGFWHQCRQMIDNLPRSITVTYMGEMPNDRLPDVLKDNHIFSLPTKGENFGHAIFEALSFGKPVLISDQTPWRNLEHAKAGWDIPLEKPEQFEHAIAEASAWGQDEYNIWSKNAFDFARRSIDVPHLKQQYRELFS